jgi:ribosome-binding protein aMBF1 (putative translation factor)
MEDLPPEIYGLLTPRQKLVFWLYYDKGLRVYEIADQIGILRSSTCQRLHAAEQTILRGLALMKDTSFGARVQCARLKKGWSRLELATAAEIPDVTLRKYESGQLNPSWRRAILLSHVLGVSLDRLNGK